MQDGTTIDPAHFRTVLGHFATGVTIVTATTADGPVGFTCQSFSALSLEPPLIWIAPGSTSTTWPKIAEVGAFTVNVLGADQEPLCRAFAVSGADKFVGVGFEIAVIDCTIASTTEAGDHLSVVGTVVAMDAKPGAPLLFFRGGFGQFAQ